jgi:hypothetical protein
MADFDSSLPVRTQNPGDVIMKLADKTTPANQLEISAAGLASVVLKDVNIGAQTTDLKITLDGEVVVLGAGTAYVGKVRLTDGTNDGVVNADGSINVKLVDGVLGGEVNSFNTEAALAAAGTSNHDYTVTALKTLKIRQVLFAASGKMKAELQIETAPASGTFVTKAVGFFDGSVGTGSGFFHFPTAIEAAAGVIVRLIRTNRAAVSQDVYSTVIGEEI